MEQKQITVTSPLLPDLSDFFSYIEKIWDSRWLTNNGQFHQQLEAELCQYLGVPYISLFSNGTLPLIVALQASGVQGEVITTPFSFVATTHSMMWHNNMPVFVDIDPVTLNLDPQKIEAAITERTQAIMPVHVYGTPCDTDAIRKIAAKYNLTVIYDAAHAFGVTQNGQSILNEGDLSSLSFHATKVFSTLEGGALVSKDPATKQRIDDLKNFGFRDEVTVVAAGMNAKMNEVQAAFGLSVLNKVDEAIAHRKWVAQLYSDVIGSIDGLTCLQVNPEVKSNYAYFPIFIDAPKYGLTRDELYEKMKRQGILSRRYFYPLISNFEVYSHLPSASKTNLPNANNVANSVLCLPIHSELSRADVERVIESLMI